MLFLRFCSLSEHQNMSTESRCQTKTKTAQPALTTGSRWPVGRVIYKSSEEEGSAKSAVWVAVQMIFVCFSFVLNQWTLCIASASPCTGQSIDFWKIRSRIKCPCPEQGRNPNSQLSSAMSASLLPIEPKDHSQPIHRNPVNGLVTIFRLFQVLLVKLEQILHLKVDCSDFGPVQDRGSLP